MASLAHPPSGLGPPGPRLARRTDNEGVPSDLDLDFLLQPSLLYEWLGEPNATRVANANESRLHPITTVSTLYSLIASASMGRRVLVRSRPGLSQVVLRLAWDVVQDAAKP